MGSDTRERLIQTAHGIFYCEGFHAVGLDRILAEVGITKTTFYNHFASKDELVVAVLEWHDRWWQDSFRRMLRTHGGDTPLGQLLAIPDAMEELFGTDDFNGCIFVNVAVEFPAHHDPANQLARRHKAAMEDILREIAGYAGARDPAAFAAEAGLLMEGAYITRQVTGREDTAAVLRRLINMVVERHVPKRPRAHEPQ